MYKVLISATAVVMGTNPNYNHYHIYVRNLETSNRDMGEWYLLLPRNEGYTNCPPDMIIIMMVRGNSIKLNQPNHCCC